MSGQQNQVRMTDGEGLLSGSPLSLLAAQDSSERRGARGRLVVGGEHGVRVQWLRPSDLVAGIVGRSATAVVAAHLATHRRVRAAASARLAGQASARRGRLAPLSAFGSGREAKHGLAAERPPIAR